MKMKLAVIAHDGKKADMVAFLNRHEEVGGKSLTESRWRCETAGNTAKDNHL